MKKHYVIDGSIFDEFSDNNFRVVLTGARKLMPGKVFKTIAGQVTRIQ